MKNFIVLLLAASFLVTLAEGRKTAQSGRQKISLLLTNGKIFTADERNSIVEAVAIDGNKIVAVGSSKDLQSRYDAARVIDLKGKFVTPGFNDAHAHFLSGGQALREVDLATAQSLAEAQRRIASRAKELPAGAWLTGRGWDHTLWGAEFKNRFPRKEELDAATPNNPALFSRVDGHVSWANALALKAANITRQTPNPPGGEIEKDASGEPTGILKETAVDLVARVVPAPSKDELMRSVQTALDEAKRVGVTSVQDNSSYEATKLYREFARQNKLTVRVAEWQNFNDTIDELRRQRYEFQSFKDDPNLIKLTALKGYVDGSLGSRTAAMLAPYADDPNNKGIPRMSPEELTRKVVERDMAGFEIALHAIGDRANRMALDAYAAAYRARSAGAAQAQQNLNDVRKNPAEPDTLPPASPDLSPRHRIEHAQIVAPEDFARFRQLGVIASMQPSHEATDMRWAASRLGAARSKGAYAWRTMLKDGVHLAFGTDFPVEPLTPYRGLYAAVTRRSPEEKTLPPFEPQERITMPEAIRAYTTGAAYASFDENVKGQIKPGMLADLVIHSRDLLTVKPGEILQTEVLMTIFDGRVIYEK